MGDTSAPNYGWTFRATRQKEYLKRAIAYLTQGSAIALVLGWGIL
ncbi:MAG: hypothetical protein V7K92_30495 [Nostoc sp.]